MNLTIKRLPEEVSASLKEAAAESGRSLNAQVIDILARAAAERERRRAMQASRPALEAFVRGLRPVPDSARLIRKERERH